jgi:peptidoglycan/LPS O-acetylase OafA/YrhL
MAVSLAPTEVVTTKAPAARAAGRIPEIDWLRGIAALAVFVFHLSLEAGFPKRTLPPFTLFGRSFTALLSPLSLGASGVNLFFLLSGFCLALQQRGKGRARLSGPEVGAYFQGRFARIMPAYAAAVLLSALVILLLGAQAPRAVLGSAALHLFFLHGLDRTTFLSLNPALWSMVTEVQFYLLFPLLFALHARLGGALFALGTGLFTLVYRVLVALYPFVDSAEAGVSTSALFGNQLPGRLFEFTLGMVLAEIYLGRASLPRRLSSWLWLPALVAALWCRGFGPPYLPDLALGVFYGALLGRILLVRPEERRASPGLFSAWGARFGRASYSFFLVHATVLLLCHTLLPGAPEHPYRQFFFLGCVSLPVSVGVATLLYLGVELPLWRRLRG